jgi:hypothetical protein
MEPGVAAAMAAADAALAGAGAAPGGGGAPRDTGGMDAKLHAALYGPLPGGGLGGALPSEQSYQKLEKASSLSSTLLSQARHGCLVLSERC